MAGNTTRRFQVIAAAGRSSDVWRVWADENDVYVAPRAKGGEFKISLHASGKWRLAFTEEYAQQMHKLGTWNSDRRVDSLDRPAEHANAFIRAVCLYFPDSELRAPVQQKPGEIVKIPGPSKDGVRVVNVIFTTSESRFTQNDPPLRGSLGAEPLGRWVLPNGETLWVVHYELRGSRGLDREAAWFRANVGRAKKLDSRTPLRLKDSSGRIK